MKEIPSEIKIIHVHQGKDEKSSFVEFVNLDKETLLLQWNNFVKRFGVEPIEAFKTLKVK